MVDGVQRTVEWITVKHPSEAAKIISVEPEVKGTVKLDNMTEFENPAADVKEARIDSELISCIMINVAICNFNTEVETVNLRKVENKVAVRI